MNRKPPISRTQVAAAMEALLADGREPSTRAVREITGYGSNTTIAAHIAAIKAGAETPERQLESLPAQVEAPLREMLAAMGELAEQRTAQVREALGTRRQEIEGRWSELLMDKETAIQSFESEKRITNDLTQRIDALSSKLESVTADRDELKERAGVAEALNGQLNERLSDQSRQVDRMKAQAEHFAQQSAAQREQEASRYTKQIEGLESNLQDSHANELRLTEQLGEAMRKLDRLTAESKELTRRAEKAETQQGELQALISDLSVEQLESKRWKEQLESQLTASMVTNSEIQSQLARMQAQMIDEQTRAAKQVEDMVADNRSVTVNLVEHSRRVFELASRSKAKESPDFKELAIAQREIERLFQRA